MLILPAINVKRVLVLLISDAVFDFGAKHHLIAIHEVEHHILKFWLKSYWVNQVEIYLVIRGNLNSLVAFDEEHESSDVENTIFMPKLDGWVIFVVLDFEE